MPEVIGAGGAHVMVGVLGPPGGVQEYGFWRLMVVVGDQSARPVLLSLMLICPLAHLFRHHHRS